MSYGGVFYSLLITASVALITYNAIVVSRSTLADTFLGPRSSTAAAAALADPVIRMPGRPAGKRLFHTAVTASGSVYSTWQCRVMYYWFKRAHAAGSHDMGGFTRILHSGQPDNFTEEIPTFVADPLSDGVVQDYIVLNRPWAFVQWLQKADIKEDYILMAEPDHIIVKPIPNLSKDGFAAAFPFLYMDPKKFEAVLRNFFPEDKGPITNIDPIGNSPVIIEKASLMKLAPTWMNVSLAMKKDPEADKTFGWVLEMYAYAVASALHRVGNILYRDFMIQPPFDLEVGEKFIIHYTYGCDYDMKGHPTFGRYGEWRFDKRSYESKPPPRNLPLPPAGVPQSVVTLIKMLNEATANIPDWESYRENAHDNEDTS